MRSDTEAQHQPPDNRLVLPYAKPSNRKRPVRVGDVLIAAIALCIAIACGFIAVGFAMAAFHGAPADAGAYFVGALFAVGAIMTAQVAWMQLSPREKANVDAQGA